MNDDEYTALLKAKQNELLMTKLDDLPNKMEEASKKRDAATQSVEHHVGKLNDELEKIREEMNKYESDSLNIKEFLTGARRSTSGDNCRLDLIHPLILAALGSAYAEGFIKYPSHNYLKGFPYSILLQHLKNHLLLWELGDRTEDHLGHALWNLGTLLVFFQTRPDLNDLPPYNITPEQLAKFKEQYFPESVVSNVNDASNIPEKLSEKE